MSSLRTTITRAGGDLAYALSVCLADLGIYLDERAAADRRDFSTLAAKLRDAELESSLAEEDLRELQHKLDAAESRLDAEVAERLRLLAAPAEQRAAAAEERTARAVTQLDCANALNDYHSKRIATYRELFKAISANASEIRLLVASVAWVGMHSYNDVSAKLEAISTLAANALRVPRNQQGDTDP